MSFQNLPIWINLLIFGAAAAAIWYAGTRLERHTDAISRRTQLGKAFLGLLLLSTATGLPKIATTTTAILAGNRELALYNLFGSIIIQTAILAGVDILVSKGPLTRFTPDFAVLMEGVGLMLVIAAGLMGLGLDAGLSAALNIEDNLLPIGLGPPIAFAASLLMIFFTHRAQGRARWLPAEAASSKDPCPQKKQEPYRQEQEKESTEADEQERAQTDEQLEKLQEQPWSKLLLAFAGFALIVLAGGGRLPRPVMLCHSRPGWELALLDSRCFPLLHPCQRSAPLHLQFAMGITA